MKTGGSAVQDQPQLHGKFKARLGYVTPCPEKNKQKIGTRSVSEMIWRWGPGLSKIQVSQFGMLTE